MDLSYFEPRYLRQIPNHLISQSVHEYRQALDLLLRSTSAATEPLRNQLQQTIQLMEAELARRSQPV